MAASFSTLTPNDRILALVPSNPTSVHCESAPNGDFVTVQVSSFHGNRKLQATRVAGDCFDVTVTNYPHVMGQRKRPGRVVRFTTTECWVLQWKETAHAAALASNRFTK